MSRLFFTVVLLLSLSACTWDSRPDGGAGNHSLPAAESAESIDELHLEDGEVVDLDDGEVVEPMTVPEGLNNNDAVPPTP